MATKAKHKSKATRKAAKRAAPAVKSIRLKAKARKFASRNGSGSGEKPARVRGSKRAEKVESRRNSVASAVPPGRSTSPPSARSKHFASAVQAYEAGIKLMHAEEFEKAIRCFGDLIADHPEEPEIQERAKVLLHACEKKLQENERTVLRSADDHYNVGIAELNRREMASAIQHLEHALKLMPKADHVHYALAAANAIQANRDQALNHLKQAIHLRPENRFLAARDGDFESLQEDPDFKQLVTPPEK
jgi:tetratricopeptide (TPR) repeat protein